MNTTQAMIIMNSGVRKYGTILEGEFQGKIKFIPNAEILIHDEQILSSMIEHISVSNIYSIDTFLK